MCSFVLSRPAARFTILVFFFSVLLCFPLLAFAEVPPDIAKIPRKVLVLSSYHRGYRWSDDIVEGINSVFGPETGRFQLDYEYMDAGRQGSPDYLPSLFRFYGQKFRDNDYDLVICADGPAFRFVTEASTGLFRDCPVVFCGIDDLSRYDLPESDLLTGVLETVDLKGTLDLALDLHPGVKQVVVIGGGGSHERTLHAMAAEYSDRAEFLFLDGLGMSALRDRVRSLGPDSLIFFPSFNSDSSNNGFPYKERLRLIAEKARVPIYGVWDFYLGKGLVGGRMTSGFSQGEAAAGLAKAILDGKPVTELPMAMESPNRYMFDYAQLARFGIGTDRLPPGSRIVNRPDGYVRLDPVIALGMLFAVGALAVTVVFLAFDRRRRKKMEAELRYYATTDEMTGVVNRRTGLAILEQQLAQAERDGRPLCICFVDLNNLKKINDCWGHDRGDRVIQALSRILREKARASDVVCRLGGDEFLIILPGCTLVRAEQFWERVRRAIYEYNVCAAEGERISASRGFAGYAPGEPVTVDDLIRQADLAMYRDKERAKSRCLSGATSSVSVEVEDRIGV